MRGNIKESEREKILIELKRNMGLDFEELGVIDFDRNELIKERVLKNDFTKIYTLKDISKWVEYGLKNGMIKRSGEREDVELMMKWIDLLGKGGKNIQL